MTSVLLKSFFQINDIRYQYLTKKHNKKSKKQYHEKYSQRANKGVCEIIYNNKVFTGAVFINNKPFSEYNHIDHKTVDFNLFLFFRYKSIVLF